MPVIIPHITIIFASLLALVYVWLILQVVSRRRRYRTPYGYSDQHTDLERAVRAHGNFQEYAPLFIILLYFFEITIQLPWLCTLIGGLFLLGRISHACSLLWIEADRLKKGHRLASAFRLRIFGMVQTLTAFIVMATLLLFQYVWSVLV